LSDFVGLKWRNDFLNLMYILPISDQTLESRKVIRFLCWRRQGMAYLCSCVNRVSNSNNL